MKPGWGSIAAEIIKFLFGFIKGREEKKEKKRRKRK